MTSPTVDEIGGTDARFDRLAEAVKGLRARLVASTDAPKLLVNGGPAIIGLGAGLVLLGWYGAAHTTRLYLQIPYLISGGLLGVGLIVVGSFAFFSRWITDLMVQNQRLADENAAQQRQTLAVLERIEELLADVPTEVERPARTASSRHTARRASAGRTPTAGLVATAKGRLVHRADCRLVEGRSTRAVDASEDLDPCLICEPDLG